MSAAASERRSSASRIVRQSASSVRPRAVGGVLVVMAAGAVSVRGLACRCARPEDSRLSPAAVRATALIGTDELTLRCRGEEVVHPRQPFGGRRVDYRHYLAELARKPQAVRQVAPELVAALGEPFGPLWARLEREQGAQEGARTLARLLRAVDEHGERRVREVLARIHRSKLEGAGCRAAGAFGGRAGVRRAVPERGAVAQRRSARLGGAEGAGARVREACAGMLARASEPGRRCERASGRER